ncbi:MAG: cation:proton antiporter [Myxococcales bacterium]|jgi:NhaP-type Na+/H+ or K+/H+ antiporter
MAQIDVLFLLVGAAVVLLSFGARVIRQRLWISEPLAALALGASLGPAGLGWVDVPVSDRQVPILEHAARLTVALSIMGVALRLPDDYLRRRWRQLLIMLIVVMPLMWLLASVAAFIALGLSPLLALWLGAVVTPTDPVLADAIVTGDLAERSIDEEVRRLISAEAGANDGLAFLLVMLPVTFMQASPWEALGRWIREVLLIQVALAVAIGAASGWGVGRLIRAATSRNEPDATPHLAVLAALAVALLGGVKLLHSDGLVAVFAAGLAFNAVVGDGRLRRQREIQEVITRFFDAPVFILFGLWLPVDGWRELGAPGLAFAALVLLLRRLPVVVLLRRLLGPIGTLPQALFTGWFGPVGAAALVYATWAQSHAHRREIWVAGSLVVCASVIVHGLTATPFTRAYARSRRDHTAGQPG